MTSKQVIRKWKNLFIIFILVTSKIRFASSAEAKKELIANFVDNILPTWLGMNGKILEQRGGQHFSGGKVKENYNSN